MPEISNIDAIVELFLREPWSFPQKDNVQNIYSVMMKVDSKITTILSNIREEERRKKQGENKE